MVPLLGERTPDPENRDEKVQTEVLDRCSALYRCAAGGFLSHIRCLDRFGEVEGLHRHFPARPGKKQREGASSRAPHLGGRGEGEKHGAKKRWTRPVTLRPWTLRLEGEEGGTDMCGINCHSNRFAGVPAPDVGLGQYPRIPFDSGGRGRTGSGAGREGMRILTFHKSLVIATDLSKSSLPG